MEFVDSLDDEGRTLEVHKIDVERKGCRKLYAYVRIKATGQPYDLTEKVVDGGHDLAYITTKLGFDKDGDPISASSHSTKPAQASRRKTKSASRLLSTPASRSKRSEPRPPPLVGSARPRSTFDFGRC